MVIERNKDKIIFKISAQTKMEVEKLQELFD